MVVWLIECDEEGGGEAVGSAVADGRVRRDCGERVARRSGQPAPTRRRSQAARHSPNGLSSFSNQRRFGRNYAKVSSVNTKELSPPPPPP